MNIKHQSVVVVGVVKMAAVWRSRKGEGGGGEEQECTELRQINGTRGRGQGGGSAGEYSTRERRREQDQRAGIGLVVHAW